MLKIDKSHFLLWACFSKNIPTHAHQAPSSPSATRTPHLPQWPQLLRARGLAAAAWGTQARRRTAASDNTTRHATTQSQQQQTLSKASLCLSIEPSLGAEWVLWFFVTTLCCSCGVMTIKRWFNSIGVSEMIVQQGESHGFTLLYCLYEMS